MEYKIRPLQKGDDLDQVAKLIYLTDPYIYPDWFDSIEDGIKVIKRMIELPSLYNKENVTVAVLESGFVLGVLVAKQAPFIEEIENAYLAFEKAGVKSDDRTKTVYNDYYSKLGNEEDGYHISNVTVDENYRKRGIATALIKHAIKDKSVCTLECIVSNDGAWKIYQRLGFEKISEFIGAGNVLCYKMKYEKKEY